MSGAKHQAHLTCTPRLVQAGDSKEDKQEFGARKRYQDARGAKVLLTPWVFSRERGIIRRKAAGIIHRKTVGSRKVL